VRSLLQNRRGQIRVIEAFFAAVLMLSSLTLIPTVQRLSSSVESVQSSTALNVLATLDSDGHLSELVDQRNWSSLRSCVASLVSPALWFNLTVYDQNMTPLNDRAICSGGAISDNIDSAEYLCVSPDGTFSLYFVRLQLAGLN
jgi:hypothetical protein